MNFSNIMGIDNRPTDLIPISSFIVLLISTNKIIGISFVITIL